MPDATTFEAYDKEKVRELFAVLPGELQASGIETWDDLFFAQVSENWNGFFEWPQPNEVFEASPDPRNPLAFAQWRLQHDDEVESFFDPEAGVVRSGNVFVVGRFQANARQGAVDRFVELLKKGFRAHSNEGDVAFFEEQASQERALMDGLRTVEVIVPFIGV